MESKATLQPFDVTDTTSIASRWKKWKRSLELFMEVNCIALGARKKSYLLHYAGPDVQDIFYNIEGHDAVAPPGSDVYKEAIRLLDAHFAPLSSVPYERVVFRRMKREENETLEKFIHRLRDQGQLCEYGDALEMRITEQVFDNGNSDALREVILKKKLMTVQEIAEEGRILETVKKNREDMKKNEEGSAVNFVRKTKSNDVCFRCGNSGHYASDKWCPARSQKCDKCNLVGHFKSVCKTKVGKKFERSARKSEIRQVKGSESERESDSSSEEDVQHVYATGSVPDKVTCFVGGIKLDWVVDSGAHVNVISRPTWKQLKKLGCVVSREEPSSKTLRAYGDGKLKVYKVVKADIATRKKTVHHEIYVVENQKGANLLSRGTSIELGLLEIRGEVFSVAEVGEPPIGKLKGVQVQIKVDEKITPVQQACRRIPIPLKKLVDDRLEDLLRQDIIEPAPFNISWASPLVVTPKDGGRSVRLCVDMRKANKAIVPEKHPLPTFEEIVPHLNGCKVFSKVDLVKAFHQIELAPESRDITTFVTPDAYYRYKRLMFGMGIASEVFQRNIERVLKGLDGVKVFIDDMLVYGSTKKEHDLRLKAVLQRLKENGLTINDAKCEFGKSMVKFMGHELSANGILPTNDKFIFGESSTPNQRQERWVLRMQSYRHKIVYVPGEVNIADPLSRLCEAAEAKTFDKASEGVLCSIVEVNKPSAVTMSEVIRSSRDDEEIQKVKVALHDDCWDNLKPYAPFKGELCFVEEILLRKNKLVIPMELRQTVLQLTHVGHPGKEKMKRRIRTAIWWPGVDAAVEKFCRNCTNCQIVGQQSKPEPLRIRELPSAPWIHLSMDFLGPLPNGKYVFVLVDLYSRFVVAELMTSTTSAEVIRRLKKIFTQMGLPLVLQADNAKNFCSQELKDYCVDFGIKLVHTTPYWPSANGEVERQNRSFLKVMKISQLEGSNLEEAMQSYLYMYSLTPHCVTGVAPATLMHGRRFRDLVPHLQEEAIFDEEMRDRDKTVKHNAKEYRDKRVDAKESSVAVGDTVLMKNMQLQNKLSPGFLPTPGTVVHRYGSTATVETASGQQYKRNVAHLKELHPQEAETVQGALDPACSGTVTTEQQDQQGVAGSSRERRTTVRPKRFEDYLLE